MQNGMSDRMLLMVDALLLLALVSSRVRGEEEVGRTGGRKVSMNDSVTIADEEAAVTVPVSAAPVDPSFSFFLFPPLVAASGLLML